MGLHSEKTIAEYDFDMDAMGLGDFIVEQLEKCEHPIVYVRDEKSGASASKARWTEETLSDSSKVYNLYIDFD